MAVGIGEKTFSAENITESNGPAFIYSGELLEHLKDKKESLGIHTPWKEWDEEMNASLSLAVVIMDQWKPKTAWLASSILRHPGKSQQEIAEMLDMQQAGVSQGLNRAHLKELKEWDIQFRKKLKTQIDTDATAHQTPDRHPWVIFSFSLMPGSRTSPKEIPIGWLYVHALYMAYWHSCLSGI